MNLAIASLALFVSMSPPKEVRTWRFKVLLGDRAIGSHTFRLEGDAGARRLTSEARFAVKLLFIDAYRYSHTATESWRGDCLESLTARTDDNGKRRAVTGSRTGDAFEVVTDRAKTPRRDPACVMSFAYWNPTMLSQTRLLNPQTGELSAVQVEQLATETVDVRGAPQAARRYSISSGTFRIDVWYAEGSGEWVRLETRTGNPRTSGRRITYVLE